MNYKGILTDEFVEGLKKEEVSTVVLLIYKDLSSSSNEKLLLRGVEIDIGTRKICAVAGKTVKAQKALELNFSKNDDDRWYRFGEAGSSFDNCSSLLKIVARMCSVSEDELESAFLKKDELT